MYLYRHKFLTLLLSLSSVCAHDSVEHLENDQAQILYELAHQLIEGNKEQTTLLHELERLQNKKKRRRLLQTKS